MIPDANVDTGVVITSYRVVMLIWRGREVTGPVIFAAVNILGVALWALNRYAFPAYLWLRAVTR
jgi:hypothetical protein